MKLVDFINNIDLEKMKSVEFGKATIISECNENKFYMIREDCFSRVIEFVEHLRTLSPGIPPKRTIIRDEEFYVYIVKTYEAGNIKDYISCIYLTYEEILGMEIELNYHDLDDFKDQVRYFDQIMNRITNHFTVFSEQDKTDYKKSQEIQRNLQTKQKIYENSAEIKNIEKKSGRVFNLMFVYGIISLIVGTVLLKSSINTIILVIIPCVFLFLYTCNLQFKRNKKIREYREIIINKHKEDYPGDIELFDKYDIYVTVDLKED